MCWEKLPLECAKVEPFSLVKLTRGYNFFHDVMQRIHNSFQYKNQNVAVKIINKGETPEEISRREARFAREVAMLSRVQHKNLVKFIRACKEPVMVIVTELQLGGTLRKYLLNMRPKCLDMPVAVGFALDIARAMECLHSHGIIHRDLKPDNLILTDDHKTVKLADFGLAREESLTDDDC
ncbi:hypothetical protein AAZV13_19G002701 [Glycine max]